MAKTELDKLVDEVERVVPLFRSLSGLEEKERATQARVGELTATCARLETRAVQAKRDAEGAIESARLDMERRTEDYKLEVVTRNAKAREKFDAWSETARKDRLKMETEITALQAELTTLRADAEKGRRELESMHAKLSAAKADFAKALAGVGA